MPDPAIEPAQFSQSFALRDGTPAIIRVMRPDDKDRLIAAFSKLDRASVYTRFFGYRKSLPEGPLNRIDKIDFVHLAGLVVSVGNGADETVIGSATYVVEAAPEGDALVAEVAFTIEEDFQGQGLARRLLAALAGIARAHGIARIKAEVLGSNSPMLAVFQRSGLPMTRRSEGGVVHLVLDLQPAVP